MTARFIGGHWAWSPQMQRLALENRIEAYNLPQGVLVSNYREMAARRAGTLTRTGLHTFVDPRMGGGKVNSRTKADPVSYTHLDVYKRQLWATPFLIIQNVTTGHAAGAFGVESPCGRPFFSARRLLASANRGPSAQNGAVSPCSPMLYWNLPK